MSQKKKSFLIKLIQFKRILFRSLSLPTYRVLSIKKTEAEEYLVVVQIVGKRFTFEMKPEEILSDDKLTDKFSSRDVRALTYLGYLGINSPKYKILAQRLAENEKIVFAIHKKGSKKVELKTAEELSQNTEILKNLAQKDAHTVVYTAAKESVLDESRSKTKAKSLSKENEQ